MKLLKFSKYALTTLVCSSLLTAAETSLAATPSDFLGQNASSNSSIMNYGSSMWATMGKNFNMKVYTDNPRVQQQITVLLKNKSALYNLLQQAGPTISYVYQQMRKHNLPAELALLPYVESGFNPQAKSPVGAKGLWQLMPKTASGLGVKTAANYDGCKDIIASTAAAANYLIQLGQSFDRDWYLALAAYNWGPGNVKKAVKKQIAWYKRSNFWSLKLPKETQDYVPKLLALAEIIKNPARYGITLPPINNGPHLTAIKVAGKVDFKKITDQTSLSMDTMRKLNPGYTNAATTSGAPNTLLVPVDKVEEVTPLVTVLASTTDIDTHPDQEESALAPSSDDSQDGTNNNTDDTNSSDQSQTQAINDSEHNVHLVKTILQEGKWLIFTLANIPRSDTITAAA